MVKFASIGMFTFQLSLETVTKNDKKPFSICYLSWLIGIISEILCVCVCARLELSNSRSWSRGTSLNPTMAAGNSSVKFKNIFVVSRKVSIEQLQTPINVLEREKSAVLVCDSRQTWSRISCLLNSWLIRDVHQMLTIWTNLVNGKITLIAHLI